MYRIFLCIRMLLLLYIGAASMSAYAYFQSLHQFPVQYITGIKIGQSGELIYTQSPVYIGFKEQYKPSGVSGCTVGYPGYESLCLENRGGFSFELSDYSSYSEYKVFIPAGTKFFSLTGYFPQAVRYAVAVKLGQPPSRSRYLDDQEYQSAKFNQNLNADFAKLLAGEERIMVHDGGGAMNLSGIGRMKNNPMQVGQWLYVRVLNGSDIHRLGASYEIDRDMYKKWYDATLEGGGFGSDGDPLAGFEPPLPTLATATVENIQQPPANPAILRLKVKHPANEVAQGGYVKYFVVGLIPAQMFAETTPWLVGDVPFFLADFPDGRRWTLLFQGQDFKEVAFDERGHTLKEIQDSIDIPLVFTMAELQTIKAKVRFGYTINDGPFKAMDVLWDPRSNESSDSRD